MRATAYGFALHANNVDAEPVAEFRRSQRAALTLIAADGLSLAVRHYRATPESVADNLPLISSDLVLAYEGRVDNRAEIAHLLGRPGIARMSDGNVLSAAYDRWGADLAARVVGEYAYVLWDRRERRIVAGTDALGIRRLFYATRGPLVWIASNLRLLFEVYPAARSSFNRDVLREYFAGTMSPWSGQTIWAGISELRRGNVLVQRGCKLDERTAWKPDSHPTTSCRTAMEVDEEFRRLLFQGVRCALRARGPVLCDLSGGFDSSTVCSVAALLAESGEYEGTLTTWSVLNGRSNEAGFQNAVRARYRLEPHGINIADHLPFGRLEDTALPSAGFLQCGALNRSVRQLAYEKGLTALITGHGADALLHKGTPPPVYLAEWLREGRLSDWARDLRKYLRSELYSAWHLLRYCSVGTLDLHAGRFRSPIPDWITPRFRSDIEDASREFTRGLRTFRSIARERVYRWTQSFIPQHGESLPDERLPLLYRPLVEFLLGLDWSHLTRPGEDRLLMRRALTGILPAEIRHGRPRGSHGAPLFDGLRVAWPHLGRFITGEQLADLGVVDRDRFRAALVSMRGGYAGPNARFSYMALCLETWLGTKETLMSQGVIEVPPPSSGGVSCQ